MRHVRGIAMGPAVAVDRRSDPGPVYLCIGPDLTDSETCLARAAALRATGNWGILDQSGATILIRKPRGSNLGGGALAKEYNVLRRKARDAAVGAVLEHREGVQNG